MSCICDTQVFDEFKCSICKQNCKKELHSYEKQLRCHIDKHRSEGEIYRCWAPPFICPTCQNDYDVEWKMCQPLKYTKKE